MASITDPKEAAAALKEIVDGTDNLVFFGGAGVSTASGIPDFRSEDGLYRQHFKYSPETMLGHDFYVSHTAEFYDFYRSRMIALDARPNQAHLKLAQLEAQGKLRAVITQNIDGLHQAAGSKNVLELHGSVHRNICQRCGKTYDARWIVETQGAPRCPECAGPIKPDVVLYGESLDEKTLVASVEAIQAADVLIIGGTSLVVYPAAGLVNYFGGSKLVIVNKQPTPQDVRSDLLCACDIAQAFDF